MALKAYWDHEEHERAKLTEEQIETMIEIQAMLEGVVKPPPIRQRRTPADIVVHRTTCYRVTHSKSHMQLPLAFKSEEDVRVFLALNPLLVTSDWETRTEYVDPMRDGAAVVTMMPDELAVLERKEELKAAAADREKIEAERRTYSTKLQAWEKLRDKIVRDWYEQQERFSDMGAISMAYKDYVRIAKGDKDVALACLHKSFGAEEVKQAAKWLGDEELARDLPAAEQPAPKLPPTHMTLGEAERAANGTEDMPF